MMNPQNAYLALSLRTRYSTLPDVAIQQHEIMKFLLSNNTLVS